MLLLLSLFACSPECDPDSDDLTGKLPVFADADQDGFGQGEMVWTCQVEAGFSEVQGDCDDGDAEIHPNADETCDGIDNDCSGAIDEDAVDQALWYPDFDGDGFGDSSHALSSCSAPAAYVADAQDCDDTSSSVNPSTVEVCNGIDDNCDGQLDEDTALDALIWFADDDGDGEGDALNSTLSCSQPQGYTTTNTDCEDGNAEIFLNQEEICDRIDNNCDGVVDFDGWLPGDYADLDDVMDNAGSGDHVCLGAGTFNGGHYQADRDLYLHGSGMDQTTIDPGGDRFYLTYEDYTLGLYDLEFENVVSGDGKGGLVYSLGGDLIMTRVRIQDASCQTTEECAAGLAYLSNGRFTAQDVVVDGFTWEPDNPQYGTMLALFYGNNMQVDVRGMEIINSHLVDVSKFAGLSFDLYGGSASISDLSIRDNTIECGSIIRGMLASDQVHGIEISNLSIAGNDFTTQSGSTFGLSLVDSTSKVRNMEISENTVNSTRDPSSLVGLQYGGSHVWENLLVTDNRVVTSEGYLESGFFTIVGASMVLSNADFSHNEFRGLDRDGDAGFAYVYESTLSVSNVNIADVDYAGSTMDGFFLVKYFSDFEQRAINMYESAGPRAWVYDDYWAVPLDLYPSYEEDPLYTDPSNGDYTLASGSPMIDAGDPDILDADGSVSDVGAYGGPYGGSW